MQHFFLLWFFHNVIFFVVVVFHAYSPFVMNNQDEQQSIFIFLCGICLTGYFAARVEFLPSDMGGLVRKRSVKKSCAFFLTAHQILRSNR